MLTFRALSPSPERIRSDQGPTLETSAFQKFHFMLCLSRVLTKVQKRPSDWFVCLFVQHYCCSKCYKWPNLRSFNNFKACIPLPQPIRLRDSQNTTRLLSKKWICWLCQKWSSHLNKRFSNAFSRTSRRQVAACHKNIKILEFSLNL